MLLVKTYLDRSRIQPEQVASLHPAARERIEKYTYLDRSLGKLVPCGDERLRVVRREPPGVVGGAPTPAVQRNRWPGEPRWP